MVSTWTIPWWKGWHAEHNGGGAILGKFKPNYKSIISLLGDIINNFLLVVSHVLSKAIMGAMC